MSEVKISMDRAIEILDRNHRECYEEQPDGLEQVYAACTMGQDALKRILAGELVPVRHGHWALRSDYHRAAVYACSECGRTITVDLAEPLANYPYCHCGSRMDVADKDVGIMDEEGENG